MIFCEKDVTPSRILCHADSMRFERGLTNRHESQGGTRAGPWTPITNGLHLVASLVRRACRCPTGDQESDVEKARPVKAVVRVPVGLVLYRR